MKSMKNLKVLSTGLFAMFLMAGSVYAQSFKANNKQDDFSVRYTGTEANYLLFEVAIFATGEGSSILKISDKAEGELYSQNWKPKVNTQLFKIEKQAGQQIVFNLQVGDKVYTRTFSAVTQLVEKTTVQENGFVVL